MSNSEYTANKQLADSKQKEPLLNERKPLPGYNDRAVVEATQGDKKDSTTRTIVKED